MTDMMRKVFLFILLLASLQMLAQQKQMTLEDAILGASSYLRPETIQNLSWQNDEVLTFVENDTLWAETAKKGEKKFIATRNELNSILSIPDEVAFRRFPDYSWIDGKLFLVQNNGSYFVFNPETKKCEYEIALSEKAENTVFNRPGKFVAYTVEDDLFVTFSNGETVQITTDGGNGIVNGKTVHRSEFGITNGIFDSPNGKFIAFYRKDESMVSDYPLVDYMTRVAAYNPIKYPMAGMNSEQVTVGVYNIKTAKTIFLKTGGDPEHYLTNLTWSPDEKYIYLAELNRGQDHMQLNCYDVASGEKMRTLFEETHDKYVEPLYPIQFSKINENEFYLLSRKNGWFHVYKYKTNGELISQITKGDWEVTNMLGFDEKEKFLFVEATKESPLEKHIYRVEVKSGKMDKLTETDGVHSGKLSPGGGWLIDEFKAPEIPSKTDLISANGKVLRNLHSAENPLKDYVLGENKLVPIFSADGKNELAGRLILPTDFDPTKKYPVIVYVYGGPHSQLVDKSWHYAARWWQYYMASQGYIAFTMDNRGTNNRGRDFETVVHRQLGVLETEDQMEGIKYLKSLPYVDAERIGVHGWSYGGFMTLNLMLRHPEVFKVGVAGGPVIDWSKYEVMYGERYMDRPQENPEGYSETNMLNHISNLKGKLMLIHGVQDNVVVMQHSMQFLRECVLQGKQVDFFVYPTHPHNVRGKDRLHLMEKVSRYFMENL
jgi:dipeptidyl-peptidase 4